MKQFPETSISMQGPMAKCHLGGYYATNGEYKDENYRIILHMHIVQ